MVSMLRFRVLLSCLLTIGLNAAIAQVPSAAELELAQSLDPAIQQRLLEGLGTDRAGDGIADRADPRRDEARNVRGMPEASAPPASRVGLPPFSIGPGLLPATGIEALKPFGYELFSTSPSTFAPVTNVPVPSDYRIGSGDQLNVQLFGSQNRLLRLVVGRDGQLNFPELGPIDVAGKDFEVVRQELEARVAEQMIGTQASVSMGDTRSIQVFVVGEARQPGSYTVSGLASMVSALYAAGGISETGSLRNIELKRSGEVITKLDLYDLLLRGDTRGDARLRPGDVAPGADAVRGPIDPELIPAVPAGEGIAAEEVAAAARVSRCLEAARLPRP